MSTKRVKFDPLSNIGTSKVFYELLAGHKTSKEISEILKVRSSSVLEHLRRLQEIGIVRLGEKRGKFQDYEIDFEKLLSSFIERALQEKKTHPSHLYPDETEQLKSLKDNKYFRIFVTNYLKNQDPRASIGDSAREFEDGLLHSTALSQRKDLVDMEKQEFFNKMREWRKIASKKLTYAELDLQDALARTLRPERFKNS